MTFTIKSQYEFLRSFLMNIKGIDNSTTLFRITLEFVYVWQEKSDPQITMLETF